MKARLHPMLKLVSLVLALALLTVVPASSQQELPIDPLRFTDEIRAFEAADRLSMPPAGGVVLTGSSSIRRWQSIKEDLAPLTVVPRGFGGSTMADLLYYLDRIVLPYKPRAVVLYEGDNDTGRFVVPPVKIVRQFEKIVERIHTELPATRIYVLSVKPSLARVGVWDKAVETNSLLKEVVAQDSRLRYVDVATPLLDESGKVMIDVFIDDGLHLNKKGTEIWATTIREALEEEVALE
jgi:lysophospholipase L1-like esterase